MSTLTAEQKELQEILRGVVELREQIARLQAENGMLREQNQWLRKQLEQRENNRE